ncbi:kelch-like protein 20 [Oscarella lobularis]|uniref:kelch-like protein 20 n=1 Tax=Oscarella lobularis TaxID=121494 RepID=UPI003313DD8F
MGDEAFADQNWKKTIASGKRTSFRYGEKMLEQMNALRSSTVDLCDVVLTTNTSVSVRISAHRIVLAAASSYFRAMFTLGMQESNCSTVRVLDVDAGALRTLVDYAYTGQVHVDKSNVESLFSAAHLLQFTEVVEFCADVLIELVTSSNCLNLSRFAHQYDCSKLSEVADRCVASNIVELSESDAEFLCLEADHLARILAMDELTVDSETQVVELIAKWIKHDESDRLGQVDVLRKSIRLNLTSPDTLKNLVSNAGISLLDSSCFKATDRLGEPTSHRVGKLPNILAVGGGKYIGNEENFYNGSSVERYDPVRKDWWIFPSLNASRFKAGVVNAFGSLYALGGHEDYRLVGTNKSVERYDFAQERWLNDVAPMINGRAGTAKRYVEHTGKLYALGCNSDSTAAECYDPNVNAWTAISPLNRDVRVRDVFHADGLVYVLGDSAILKYDPVSGCWLQPQIVASVGDNAIILDNVIYQFARAKEGKDECSFSTFDLAAESKVSKTSFLSYDRDNEASSEKQEDDSHVQSDNVWGSDCRRRQGHAHKSLAKHSSPKL